MSSNLPSLSLAAPMLKWPGFEVPLPVVSKLTVSGGAEPWVCWCWAAGDSRGAAWGRCHRSASPLHPAERVPSLGHRLSPVPVAGAPGVIALHLHGSSHHRHAEQPAGAAALSPGMLSCSSCSCRLPCSP